MNSIGFIGGGNIAEAIIKGLSHNGHGEIRVTNRSNRQRIDSLVEKYGIIPVHLEELIAESGIIIVAVKPKDVVGVLKVLTGFDLSGKLVISVAAGIKMATIEKYLSGAAIVRAMPNTSSAVLHSMTGLVRGHEVNEDQAAMAEEIFAAVGHVLWIPENKMNALMALSGSGPAYFYLFAECLIQSGVKLGLREKEAEVLVRETLIGVGEMMAQSGKAPGKLREEVTSPNGTTLEALKVFWGADIPQIVHHATRACLRRAEEMEGEYTG